MYMTDVDDDENFEIDDSEHVLNLGFYLHRSIMKWQDSLEAAIKLGKIEDGLISRGLSAEMVVGCAKAKGLIHWDIEEIPDHKDKNYDTILKNNKEAEVFKKKLKEFTESINSSVIDENIRTVRIADFKVFEILKCINKAGSKKGRVIV